jgi:AcrR family transcriptional regulator
MSVREKKRGDALSHIARHILDEGLPGSSLRSLAAAAGVSDRMLLYYFADKNEMLTAALGLLAMEMASVLDKSVPREPRRSFGVLLRDIRHAMRGQVLRPYMRLWLEIAARAARNEQPYSLVAGIIADGFAAWISSRLAEANSGEAALLLATVEGLVVLDAVDRANLADIAANAQ